MLKVLPIAPILITSCSGSTFCLQAFQYSHSALTAWKPSLKDIVMGTTQLTAGQPAFVCKHSWDQLQLGHSKTQQHTDGDHAL